jgi:hypothetical protein
MNRNIKIQKLAKEIQVRIDELKKLNCMVSGYVGGVGLFDYDIQTTYTNENDDNVYQFDTSFHSIYSNDGNGNFTLITDTPYDEVVGGSIEFVDNDVNK